MLGIDGQCYCRRQHAFRWAAESHDGLINTENDLSPIIPKRIGQSRNEQGRSQIPMIALRLTNRLGIEGILTRGSHLYVPEFLTPYGEPGTNADAEFWRPSVLRRPVAHATGQAGDAFLCHPFLVRTATLPRQGTGPRMNGQPAVHVRDRFALDGNTPLPVAHAIIARLATAGQN